MKIGRNDPCPCGSGKKYKKCCMGLDRLGGAGRSSDGGAPAPGAVRDAAAKAREWQADVVPLPAGFEDDPTARPSAVLVTAAGLVVGHDVLSRPSAEPEDLAELLARAFEEAVERVGAVPETLRVRHEEVGWELMERLATRDPGGKLASVAVGTGGMEDLDEAAFALFEGMIGARERFLASRPHTWAGWGLPDETVARIFSAAAAFHRAAPWETAANSDLLTAVRATGQSPRIWSVGLLGMGGDEYGMVLYSDAGDFWRLFDASGPPEYAAAFEGFRGQTIHLTFDPGHRLPRAMRREIARAGWELAGPGAFPSLITINTPGGGLPRAYADDLAAILEAVPRFVEEHAEEIEGGRPVLEWEDRGARVFVAFGATAALTERGELEDPGLSVESRGYPGPYEPLAPGAAEGPGAEPAAALEAVWEGDERARDRELRIADRFARHLSEVEGFGEETVEKHRANARFFVDFLVGYLPTPLRALHEYHLRVFLYDWFPRKMMTSLTEARSVPVSLRRFFRFLEDEEGISCPWAKPILAARDVFEKRWESCPGFLASEPAMVRWRSGHDNDLAERRLLPRVELGDDAQWGPTMGETEADLQSELHVRWLLWRDEEIRAGRTDPDDLEQALFERQRAWETTLHPRLDGKTPYRAVLDERDETARRLGRG